MVLNLTNDSLRLDTDSVRLYRGNWAPSGLTPPDTIQAGGSAIWQCRASGVGSGVVGSAVYTFEGQVPHDKVRFTWKIRYFGPNKYNPVTTREGYIVRVLGGEGDHATVVFVLGKLSPELLP